MSRDTRWGPLGPHDWVVPDIGEPSMDSEPEPVPDSDDDDAFEADGELGAEASTYIPRYIAT